MNDNRVKIPDWEFEERVKKASQLVSEKGLDVLIVNSNESDYSNARYFSNYWPLFETSGVAISSEGRAVLMCGPESGYYAEDTSKIKNICILKEYRESADPDYPETATQTYNDALKSIGVNGKKIRIGIAGYLVTTAVQMDGIHRCYPDATIERADDIMIALRSIKSENEIACLKEGFRITEIAMQEVINKIKPGMTELELVGVAQKAIYENGAEYEGLPMYVFSQLSTRHAISRPSYRVIQKNDIVQLNLSAKIDGYSPSIGYPISMGKLVGIKKEIVEYCLEMHNWTKERLKEGVIASDIAEGYYNEFVKRGYKSNYIYGPCHGLGMIEVEPPWMETSSNYALKADMTFQIDTFVSHKDFGVRWETGTQITPNGNELLSQPLTKIHELDV